MSADGLGLGDAAGDCQTDFGLDVCSGAAELASCLVRARDRAAGEIFGQARPRTSESSTLPNVALPPVAGLPAFTGCGTCGGVTPESRKAVEQCGKVLTKTRQGLGASLEKTLGGCTQKVLGCVQAKSDDLKCLAAAEAGCDKAAAKADAALAKFADAVGKKCGPASVDFSEIAASSGLGLAALDAVCPSALTDAASVAACLQSRAQCTTAGLAPNDRTCRRLRGSRASRRTRVGCHGDVPRAELHRKARAALDLRQHQQILEVGTPAPRLGERNLGRRRPPAHVARREPWHHATERAEPLHLRRRRQDSVSLQDRRRIKPSCSPSPSGSAISSARKKRR